MNLEESTGLQQAEKGGMVADNDRWSEGEGAQDVWLKMRLWPTLSSRPGTWAFTDHMEPKNVSHQTNDMVIGVF